MVDRIQPYNPLDKIHLGESIASALFKQDPVPLGMLQLFDGAGIYSIYYAGDFDLYKPLSGRGVPIYVGKAIPPGGRKGGVIDPSPGMALYKRLSEHAESIKLVGNLDIKDFTCHYLALDDIWIPLGESLVIAKFSPLWNQVIDGFGNHDPGSGRYNQLRSRWDTLHPGRTWALRCRGRSETAAQIEAEVKAYLAVL